MEQKQLAKKLKDLVQLDIDAVHAYEKAIANINNTGIREQLEAFKKDHERHIGELSQKMRELGETPPDNKPDMKGYLIEGLTALRSSTGTEGALKAMKSNEKTTNKKYDEARKLDVMGETKEMIERNYQDEKTHLEYIERALNERLWE